jgi:hypothetical protein
MRNAIHKGSSEKNGDTTPLDYVAAIGSFKEAEAVLLGMRRRGPLAIGHAESVTDQCRILGGL